jgi:hypothetical protein
MALTGDEIRKEVTLPCDDLWAMTTMTLSSCDHLVIIL